MGSGLCDVHTMMACHVVDCVIASRMQSDIKGNRLYDKDLVERVAAALSGPTDEDDEGGDAKKKGNKRAAEKKTDKSDDPSESDDPDDDDQSSSSSA